jgi:hypothetical protein
MKILYLNLLFLASSLTSIAQNDYPVKFEKNTKQTNHLNVTHSSKSSGDTILLNSFNNANDWTIGAANLQGQWQITSSTPTNVDTYVGAMASTTASNGFAVFDGIQYLLAPPVDYQDATIELNDTIDLSNYPAVSLQFEQRYRAFNYDETYIEFSIDNGTTWQSQQLNDQVATNDPAIQELVELNVSSFIGGQSNVKIRFRWISDTDDDSYGSGYGWMIDDLMITVPPANDLQNQSSWIYGENSYGAEYGRTPASQIDQSYRVGAYVYNYGSSDQTNIEVVGNFTGPTSFTTSSTAALIQSDSALSVDSLHTLSLSEGIYNGTITVTSMGDTLGSDNFGNNAYLRNFEISSDIYTLDGIGNHPAGLEVLASTGTNSFNNASDGVICATMYPFLSNDTINSVRALISSTTVENSEVILYIVDSTSFIAGLFGAAIYTSDLYVVNSSDIANGYIEIPVEIQTNNGTESLPVPVGSYYAALELYSGGNTYDIRIIDDNTVGQPAWSSAIWIPAAQAYTNGNAFAIRLNLGNVISSGNSINEMSDNVLIYPNPSNGIVNISFNDNLKKTIKVTNVSGKILLNLTNISSTIIDLNNYPKGVYLFTIIDDEKVETRKVSVK